jgi:hypothetical protein
MGWTRSKAWNTGRKQEIETFAGAVLPYPFVLSDDNTNSTGKVVTETDTERTLVTDQAGRSRISKTSALGHGGYADMNAAAVDKDRRAERVMVPVIQEHLGKRMPKSVQKAIERFNRP